MESFQYYEKNELRINSDQDKYLGKQIFDLPGNGLAINHKRKSKIITFATVIIFPIKELIFSITLTASGGISV